MNKFRLKFTTNQEMIDARNVHCPSKATPKEHQATPVHAAPTLSFQIKNIWWFQQHHALWWTVPVDTHVFPGSLLHHPGLQFHGVIHRLNVALQCLHLSVVCLCVYEWVGVGGRG